MSDAANALNRLPPAGQPAQMKDGEFVSAAPRPRLFGQGNRELSGVPKIIVVPNPAAATEWAYRWSGPSWCYVRMAVATLTTSAVVANRGAALQVSYTGIVVGGFGAVVIQPGSGAFQYCFAPITPTTAGTNFVGVAIPEWLVVKDGMTIGSSTALLSAGDQWSAIALYVEEFTDKCLDYL